MEADAPFFSLPELVEGREKMGLERTARRLPEGQAARPKNLYLSIATNLTQKSGLNYFVMRPKNNSPRENILRELRQSATTTKKESLPIRNIKRPKADLIDIFSVEFSLAAGQLYKVANHEELSELIVGLCEKNQWQKLFCPEVAIKNLVPQSLFDSMVSDSEADKAAAAFTSCEALIAEFGAILVQARTQTRKATVLAPNHIVIAYPEQIVYSIAEALANTPPSSIQSSMQSIITGPSRTADIEKTLVMGAHGSKTLHLILIT